MILYHRTNREVAEAVVREGFRDGIGNYLTNRPWRGVWLSNVPLDANEGAHGDVLLQVNLGIPSCDLRRKYEWREEGKTFREFLIPAGVVNSHAKKVEIVDASPEQALVCSRTPSNRLGSPLPLQGVRTSNHDRVSDRRDAWVGLSPDLNFDCERTLVGDGTFQLERNGALRVQGSVRSKNRLTPPTLSETPGFVNYR